VEERRVIKLAKWSGKILEMGAINEKMERNKK
jgi:hypothetical protein